MFFLQGLQHWGTLKSLEAHRSRTGSAPLWSIKITMGVLTYPHSNPFQTPQKEKSYTLYVHLNTELYIEPTGSFRDLREHTKVKVTQLLGNQESLEARERNLAVLKELCGSHTTTPQDKRNISTHTDTELSKRWEEETAPSHRRYQWSRASCCRQKSVFGQLNKQNACFSKAVY